MKRFTRVQTSDGGAMVPDDNGAFVLYADYAILEARYERLCDMARFLVHNLDDNAILTNEQINELAAMGVLE